VATKTKTRTTTTMMETFAVVAGVEGALLSCFRCSSARTRTLRAVEAARKRPSGPSLDAKKREEEEELDSDGSFEKSEKN